MAMFRPLRDQADARRRVADEVFDDGGVGRRRRTLHHEAVGFLGDLGGPLPGSTARYEDQIDAAVTNSLVTAPSPPHL